MNKLIAVVGASGVGKTALVQALAKAHPPVLSPVEGFATAYEQHTERPFHTLFKNDSRYALANQIDYLLLRAEQEKTLRASPQIGVVDGGLDLDFHGFTRLASISLSASFYSRGLLTDPEFDICRRVYSIIRTMMPPPELIVRLHADDITVASRLSRRDRINIAHAEDSALFNFLLDEWLAGIPSENLLQLEVSNEDIDYSKSVDIICRRL